MQATLALRETAQTYTATISLVAGAADPATRLVPVTATLDATDHKYWLLPGAFCEVTVPIGAARDAIVVPTMAVQPTEHGNVAYVIEGTTARARNVSIGMHTPEGGVEVTRGLAVGEQLVVRGIDAPVDGAPVKISARTTVEAAEGVDAGVPEGGAPAPDDDGGAAPGGKAGSHGGHARGAASGAAP